MTDSLWTLPNIISLSRVFLAGAFVFSSDPWIRVVIVAAAAFSDFLDGFIARVMSRKSAAGALIDPISDRFFAIITISVMLYDGFLTAGQFFIFISRDLATVIGFIVAKTIPWLRSVVFRARLLGKAVTVVQLVTLVAALIFRSALPGLIIVLGLLSALSIVDYTFSLWRARTR